MQIDDGGSGKEISVELNLVPFIDLMSVLVIFLLISAVWSQVSMIQIGSSIYGKKNAENPAKLPPQVEVPFRVDVKSYGYQVVLAGAKTRIPKKSGDYNVDKLHSYVQSVKKQYPDKVDVIITMEDELEYKELIRGMDVLLTEGFAQVAVSTAGAL